MTFTPLQRHNSIKSSKLGFASQLCGLFFLHIQNSMILNVYVSELDVKER